MSIRPTVAAVGIAAAIAGLGGAAVYAATDTQGPGHHGPPNAEGGPPRWMGGPGMDGQPHDGTDPATIHSEAVLTEGGGYRTTLFQTGTITELSETSVTVRSNDGFTQTYALPDAVKPLYGVNDRVLIRATRTGSASTDKPTVTSIGEAPRP
ncbi:hypothetical protein A5719_10445 [Mycolicibacterium peregrinum]|uniref:hypothetical protein n=1 Tax=Mycolicibacterium peregrinum TaxID=43304 RepID=UPI0007EA5521|nr:hypothetical protein [Mycolicibacterium peregrinum]OBF42851.1 hypothetical protein A5719_10445 [Mycolicibacterium peregrinum]